MASNDRKAKLFSILRENQSANNIGSTRADSLLCPLCWKDKDFSEFSIEHFLPQSVGGRAFTLTCEVCNSTHGSKLDSQIARYQMTVDGLLGHREIAGKMTVSGHEVTANITLGKQKSGSKIEIVGKASNSREADAIQQRFKDRDVEEVVLNFILYSKNRFYTGLLRSAYLAMFRRNGYEFAKADVLQVVRNRICEPSLEIPDLTTLIGELRFDVGFDTDHFFIAGAFDDVPFVQVALRLRGETESWWFVFLPISDDRSAGFFEIAAKVAGESKQRKVQVPKEAIFFGRF